MTQHVIISPKDFKVVPWKNGQGYTTELYISHKFENFPFSWRISMAKVTQNGPFSDFSGYDRILVMMQGNGIILQHDSLKENKLSKRFDIAYFSGDSKTSATLIDGEIQDFNVITYRNHCSAKVDIIENTHVICEANHFLIYPPDSDVCIRTETKKEISLLKGHLFYYHGDSASSFFINGSPVVCIQIFDKNVF